MDKPATQPQNSNARQPARPSGLYVQGRVISTAASLFKRKDGSRLVKVAHEIAIEPGVVKLERFFDAKATEVKIEGENVIEFPRLPHYEPIALRVVAYRIFRDELYVTKADILA